LLPPNKKSILFGMNDFPKHIGPYSVEAEIGRGGMGVVYRAVDSRLGRVIALKTFHQEAIAGPEGLDRFEREAQSLAALNHPNIATIHGLEQDGDQRYLVLEYVDGETLGDRLARGPLSVPEAIDVCTQIAAGLGAAHEAGVVHRDLKPANVKINTDGQVKVLDFGLALRDTPIKPVGSNDQTQLLSDMGPVTVAGTLLGTAPYMSPEQARGESVDRRSDIWAFGVILYECLTGSNPFSGPTMSDTIAAILTTEPDLTLLPPSTPPIVLHLLRRSLQRDLRSRLRDANDLRVLLEDCGLDGLGLPQLDSVGTAIINKSFVISDRICRTLDKEGFDPHLIGWQMQYADNERPSDSLHVWVPSFGEDHTMDIWQELLASTPHRTIIATPVGLEPGLKYRPNISMENQLKLLRHLVMQMAGQVKPERVIIAGFS